MTAPPNSTESAKARPNEPASGTPLRSRGPIRESEMRRVIRAVEAGGLAIARVEVDPTTSRFALIMPNGQEDKLRKTADPISAVEKIIARKGRRT